ncbi:hypothetical protein psal_cds_1208 [Pandoravirus salinus]|uniref:F-box domain containing protein n=1 Tax=Pandoravirus salinus TaxID=1349410 RepID=S4VYT9_9VIRU|nr:hypothetical protein psal_cds_1208 [Pandoravirus salinus]AGO85508.1 hypothetical protein psal_cds_1208 [Pandoravirus salinus]
MDLGDTATPSADAGQPGLADLPGEIVAMLLSWLPLSTVGACLASSRLFWVLGQDAMATQAVARTVHGADGVCPCRALAPSAEGARPRPRRRHQGIRDLDVPPTMTRAIGSCWGHAWTCLPAALTAAAASGRLLLVRALYAHAALLWYGDARCACCVDFAPDIALPHFRDHRCATCEAFLDWIFCRAEHSRTSGDPFTAALSACHARTALWIAAAADLRDDAGTQRIVDIVADRVCNGTPDDETADERLLARLWDARTKCAYSALCHAACSGDADKRQMMARMWRDAHRDGRWRFDRHRMVGAIATAAKTSARPDDALSWLWHTLREMFAKYPGSHRHMAKAAALAGCIDIATDAVCAFRAHARVVLFDRALATAARVFDTDVCKDVANGGGGLLDDIWDDCDPPSVVDGDDNRANDTEDDHSLRRPIPCAIMSRIVRSGRAGAIDVALAMWRRCPACTKRGGFACRRFTWEHNKSTWTPSLDAGLVHLVVHHPRVWPTGHAVDAVVCSGRVDLLDRVDLPPHPGGARLKRWMAAAIRDGHIDMSRRLINQYGEGLADVVPALVAATTAGRLDAMTALWAHVPAQRKARAAEAVADAAVKSHRSDIVAWLIDRAPTHGIWVAAAEQGDLDLLMRLAAVTKSPPPSQYVMVAVAHGHIACAAYLHDLSASSAPPDRKRRRVNQAAGSAASQCRTLSPSYVVDALTRGHTDAIDWAAAGPLRIPWADVSIGAALDRARDVDCFDRIVRWAARSPWARASPRMTCDLVAWAAAALASKDSARIGRLIARCPWRDWRVTPAAVASAMCTCPVALWRALDARRALAFDTPCFADAVAVSGRVDLLAWMADQRRVDGCNPTRFGVDHAKAAYENGHTGATAWILGRLDAAGSADFGRFARAHRRPFWMRADAHIFWPLLSQNTTP